jgi:peptidoglycan lytic transglycosylase D
MRMKINRYSCLITISLALLAGAACQSAKKPSSAIPAIQKTPPPAMQASAASAMAQAATAPGDKSENQTKTEIRADAKQAAAKPAPPTDKVADLIARVETLYQAGQKEYSNGHNDIAKQRFNDAFDLLQDSPADIRADKRFKHELDRVLEGMNNLELTALQTDTTAQEQSEPAPIDEANEAPETPADANLKAKAAAEVKATHSDLPLMMTDQVASYINYFSNRGRETLEHGLERGGRYREMIERILKEEGVPQDLMYLAQAESGFHPYAVSRVGARGIWQFMASRAHAYDLHRNAWVDERQDPEKSTRAAARHLKDLYNQFGDWYLAMAAYNSGPGTVQNAVKRTGYADFWELYRRNVLPRETRNYVPIILAETIMAKNPEQYGLESIVPDPEIKYDTVKIDYPVDLRLVAECVDASPDDLQDLNPSLLRMVTPKGKFELHVPVGTADEYKTAIEVIPRDMRVWWRLHQVDSGDTLASLARHYHTTAHAIEEANQLDDGANLMAGERLVIPIAPGRRSPGDVLTYAKRLTIYHVRRGDSVQSVSERLGIPVTILRRWNHLRGDSLRGRRVLYVHLPVSPGAPGAHYAVRVTKRGSRLTTEKNTGTRHHTVKRGETLYSIANTYNTSIKAIKETNSNLSNIRLLRPGMVLVIPPQR